MKTAAEIFEDMKSSFAEYAGVGINGGCDMAIRMRAAAEEIADARAYAEKVRAQCFPQTATGRFLDRHAEMRGLSRIAAAYASGSITFTAGEAASAQLTVPAGTVCMTSSGLCFSTTQAGTVTVGQTSCTVDAVCLTAGSAGNAASGTVTYMQSAPVGIVSCANAAAFSGGADAESDGLLRERVVASFRRLPNGANAAYYEQEALNVDGVAAAVVTPRARGAGTVDVTVSSIAGTPDASLISAVSARLEAAREICVDIQVSAPTESTVNVAVTVKAKSGYDAAAVRTAAANAITAYFDGRLLGCDVTLARLGSIVFGVEGVENYRITSPSADVAVGSTVLPKLGTVTVSAWS